MLGIVGCNDELFVNHILLPYLPADRPHPRIGRTPNFQWFSWEKKSCEVDRVPG